MSRSTVCADAIRRHPYQSEERERTSVASREFYRARSSLLTLLRRNKVKAAARTVRMQRLFVRFCVACVARTSCTLGELQCTQGEGWAALRERKEREREGEKLYWETTYITGVLKLEASSRCSLQVHADARHCFTSTLRRSRAGRALCQGMHGIVSQ